MTTRSIAYLRVSTDYQADSGLGLDAQRERCSAYAVAMGYEPVTIAVDAGVSGTTAPHKRPAMAQALRDLDNGSAAVLIVASLSRLGRSTRDMLDLAARADANGWALAILDLNLDTATPTGRFTLTMLAAVAQLEREQTSERTAAALAAKKAQGPQLGRPASAATRAAGARALDLRADGLTWRTVAQALTDEGYATRGGGPWHAPQHSAQPAPSPSTATPPTNRPAMAPRPTPRPPAHRRSRFAPTHTAVPGHARRRSIAVAAGQFQSAEVADQVSADGHHPPFERKGKPTSSVGGVSRSGAVPYRHRLYGASVCPESL